MPAGNPSENGVLNKSHIANIQASHNNTSSLNHRTSSNLSLGQHLDPGPSHDSEALLTPEESPSFRTTRKRSAGIVEQEDKAFQANKTTTPHTRIGSDESAVHFCICQPDPKIPRPRNAFILYRQQHQARVAAQNPGLANPEISKIIGEQWQNEATDVKNKWKAFAEEEKLRHQQRYPNYRYQPKRNGRRNSLSDEGGSVSDKPNCQKCGGRTTLTPSAPTFTIGQGNSIPPTPGSVVTPVTRTLPVFRDMSLQSPSANRMARVYPSTSMAPDERDDIGPLGSPEHKRRRFEGNDHPHYIHRAMPPRYSVAPPGAPVGPGTPFPFAQPGPVPHPYPPAVAHNRRDSLPGIRGVVSPPGSMAPPPRASIGYQQHRLSQGHVLHDRSLTLPPLHTSNAPAKTTSTPLLPDSATKTTDDHIMNISFRYKIKVLSQVAPPARKSQLAPRGPLIAVEGDSPEVARQLAEWLTETLNKGGDDLAVNLIDGPDTSTPHDEQSGKEVVMAQYHRLAAEWLESSRFILESISMKTSSAAENVAKEKDEQMVDVTSAEGKMPLYAKRIIDEDYDVSNEDPASPKPNGEEHEAQIDIVTKAETLSDHSASNSTPGSPVIVAGRQTSKADSMEIDSKRVFTASVSAASSSGPRSESMSDSVKPVTLIPNYSLHASNCFARLIPIGPHDPYAPSDHWQWTATLWRGIIGPDLTIYVRDGTGTGASLDIEDVEGAAQGVQVFIVRKAASDGEGPVVGVEASVLRRIGFEVCEWVRAFAGAV